MSHLVIAPLAGVQPRLEINNFVRNDMQFSLYVQALNRMQQVDQAQDPSFFQVGGIHGLPFAAWSGSNLPGFRPQSGQWLGYCTHGSTLFPTWHRPYVMLIEQIIQGHAQQIANNYTVNTAQWKAAAANLRQPYWDWASNMVPPPQVIEYLNVEITGPDGRRVNVTNPLKSYRFHPIDSSFPDPYDQWPQTLRQPNSNGPGATDDVNELRSVLSNSQRSTTSNVYNMFTRINTWLPFASHTRGAGKGGSANSLESIHDNIHVLVGGNGHMSDPAVAGFDPIFFLHHANVDRMIALWSAINYNTWVANGDAQAGTWTLNPNQRVTATSNLTPFWRSQTTYWTSNQVRDFTTLGYTYPEFAGLNLNNKAAVRTAILQKVRQLYGPQSPPMQRRSFEGGADSVADVGRRNTGSAVEQKRHSELVERQFNLGQLLTGNYSDWSAQVLFKRSEPQHSFSVVFFLDQVPTDPKQWLTSDNFVGAHHAFLHGMQCAACDGQNDVEEGYVPLNPYIVQKGGPLSFASNLVEPFLTSRLQWRVLSTDGTEMNLDSLEVTILETPLDFASNQILPKIGNIVAHTKITRGRRGGFSGKYGLLGDIIAS